MAARVARANAPGGVNWSNGKPFNGFILIGVVPPTSGGSDWPSVSFGFLDSSQRLPPFYVIKINNGVFDSSAAVFYNADLIPENVVYVAWYYDANKRMIAGPTTQFTVSSDPFTPPIPTLTAPSSGSNPPQPNG